MARQKKPFDAVQFTRESSERIARVVRAAETSLPGGSPLSFAPVVDGGRKPKQIRAATFSGSWPIGGNKVVTFKNNPTATTTVQNLSWPITLTGYANEDCIVGKDGTAWYLVVPRLAAATAIAVTSVASTVLLRGITLAASLDVENCSISIRQTANTVRVSIVTGTVTANYLTIRRP